MIFVTSALLISIPTIVCIFLLWDLHAIVVIVVALITGVHRYYMPPVRRSFFSFSLSLSAILITSVYTKQDDCMSKSGCISRHYHIPRNATKKWMYSGQSNPIDYPVFGITPNVKYKSRTSIISVLGQVQRLVQTIFRALKYSLQVFVC